MNRSILLAILLMLLISCHDDDAHTLEDCNRAFPAWSISTYDIPDRTDVFDVDFITDEVGYAAGKRGRIYKTEDQGKTWLQVHGDVVGNRLVDAVLWNMAFTDEYHGLVTFNRFGVNLENAGILQTHDGGQNWSLHWQKEIGSIWDIVAVEDRWFGFFDGDFVEYFPATNAFEIIDLPLVDLESPEIVSDGRRIYLYGIGLDYTYTLVIYNIDDQSMETRPVPYTDCYDLRRIDGMTFIICGSPFYIQNISTLKDGDSEWLDRDYDIEYWRFSMLHLVTSENATIMTPHMTFDNDIQQVSHYTVFTSDNSNAQPIKVNLDCEYAQRYRFHSPTFFTTISNHQIHVFNYEF